MFSPDTYQNRRKALSETIEDGIIFFTGEYPRSHELSIEPSPISTRQQFPLLLWT